MNFQQISVFCLEAHACMVCCKDVSLTYTDLLKSSTGLPFPPAQATPEILLPSCSFLVTFFCSSCILKDFKIIFFFFPLSAVWNTKAFHGQWCKRAMHQGNTWAWRWNPYGGRKREFLFLYEDHRSGCTAHGQESVNVSVNAFPDQCLYGRSDWHRPTGSSVVRPRNMQTASQKPCFGRKAGQVTISLENLWDAVKMLGRRWFNDLDINHIVNACPSLLQLLVIAASPRAFKTEGKKSWKKPLWNCSTTFPEVQAQSEISPGCGSSG